MYVVECEGINSLLVKACNLLLEHGVSRKVGAEQCRELWEPVCFKMLNPCARWITVPKRRWNIFLAYAESLWIAAGRNDLALVGHYLPRMSDFSDDMVTLRGAYGPRIRAYDGSMLDYVQLGLPESICVKRSHPTQLDSVDQLRFVIQCFKEDMNTRQAVIQIGDPLKDCFGEDGAKKVTKDLPCTRTLHFMKHPSEERLNMVVHMRSNDLLWGTTGVNIFNFTLMHEYVARILGLDLGCYFHIADNFHFYEKFRGKIEAMAVVDISSDPHYKYAGTNWTLPDFNSAIAALSRWEQSLRNGHTQEPDNFGDDFFNDWARVLYRFHCKTSIRFANPILNEIFQEKEALDE